jgi:hypothetical protein
VGGGHQRPGLVSSGRLARRRIWSARRRGTKMPASWPSRVCLLAGSPCRAYKKLRARIRRHRSLASWTDPHLGSRPPPHPPVTPIFIFGREPILSSLLLNQRRMMAMACRSSGGTSSKIRCAASCCDACDTVWWDSQTYRLFVWQAQRGIACRCLSACLPACLATRECVRACTERTPNLPGRASWLLGTSR